LAQKTNTMLTTKVAHKFQPFQLARDYYTCKFFA